MPSSEQDAEIIDAMTAVSDAAKDMVMAQLKFHEAESTLVEVAKEAESSGYSHDRMVDLYRQWADEQGVGDKADAALAEAERRKLFSQIGRG